jgi:hypothetical protein
MFEIGVEMLVLPEIPEITIKRSRRTANQIE